MVGATASLKAKGLVESRRKTIAEIREETAGWLDKKGYSVMPSEANMLMIDVRRPGRQVFTAMLAQGVAIGRTWASMPNHVRVSIGTRDEMAKFRGRVRSSDECLIRQVRRSAVDTGGIPWPETSRAVPSPR